jgi:hypothetical protein
MGKREIFEERDYLIKLLTFYEVHKDPEYHEDLINAVLDRILYLKELVEIFN